MKICMDCEHLESYWKTVQGLPGPFSRYLCLECTKRDIEVDWYSKGSCSEFKKKILCPNCGYRFKEWETHKKRCPRCFLDRLIREEANHEAELYRQH